MKIRVEQALFGYDEGHRLMASSRALGPETQRLLRSLTDAAFEGSANTFLTIQPLSTEKVQAFVRTWRADDWNRPGSVWSHVLLIEHSELSKMTGFGAIAKAFRRPQPRDGVLPDPELAAYRSSVELQSDNFVEASRVDSAELRDLVRAIYSTNDPVQYRVKQVREFEDVLLALNEQQWPRLRRSFSCRTRQRSAKSSFDLELVERLPKTALAATPVSAPGQVDTGRWVDRVVRDLLQPDETFRVFLRMCGTDSRNGRADLPPLVELYDRISRPNPDTVTTAIAVRHAFPSPKSQTLLKRALFGEPASERLGGWPTSEQERLVAALAASPAINLEELEFGKRLARLAMSPKGAEFVGKMDLEALPLEALEPVVTEVAGAVDLEAAVALANALPDLGALVVARRPELLGESQVWATVDNGLLLDLFDLQTSSTVSNILESLLAATAIEPLSAISSANPSKWWALLGLVGTRESSALVDGAEVLRAVLARIGSAALGSPPAEGLTTPGEMVGLALAADLSVGLWRRASAKDWATLVPDLSTVQPPRFVVERIYAVALASAVQSSSAKVRTQGWQQGFPFLHRALLDTTFDDEAWRLLANVLPAGSEWDRCSRLRRGAAWEARRDEWSPGSVADLVEASTPFQDDMVDLINTRAQKNKKDNWLRSVLRLLE